MKGYPKYVSLQGSILVLEYGAYNKVAGGWSVDFTESNGQLYVNEPQGPMSHCHNMELTIATEEEWRNDNKGYC